MSGFGPAVDALAALHLLRPWWLLALPVLAWVGWAWRRRHGAGAWETVVDPALREHLLEPLAPRRRLLAWWPWLAAALAIVALAGPSWRRDAQPLWEARAPLVVAFDLSPAMLAADLPPSRLARARAKVATLLRERRGGEAGLLVYAADAYTVAPLTDDPANVAVFLDALAPDIMPGEPAAADAAAAIRRAGDLLRHAGFERGDILLVSASAMDVSSAAASARAAADGYRVSVLDVVPATAPATAGVRAVAAAGGGREARLAPGDGDLAALGVLDAASAGAAARGRDGGATWRDEGFWLLLPLLVLAAFAFRRNGAIAVLALCLLLPWRPAGAQGIDWWRRADQQAHRQLEQGARQYRAGDYPGAARTWKGVPGAEADYDRGNALARQGRYEEAIAAYDEALRARPGMADAIANRKAVEAAMKRRPPPGQGDRQESDDKGDPNEGQPEPDDAGKHGSRSDADRTQAADQAGREREAARRARAGDQGQPQDGRVQETRAQHERRLANQARLQRVPDDPGGLLRARLRLEYERRRAEGE